MRHQYQEFVKRGAEILDMGPDGAEKFRSYWREHEMPFPGLSDANHHTAKLYQQEVSLLRLGRMPLVLVVDSKGIIRYRHEAKWMSDIPDNDDVLAVLDGLGPPC